MYFQIDDFNKLSKNKKIFFAAVCVERVVQVFEFNYDNTILVPRIIVEEFINSLISNNIVNTPQILKQKEELESLIPNTDEVGSEFTPSMLAGVAILHLLNAAITDEDDDIFNALTYSLEAVDSFSEYNKVGLDEEKAWHVNALKIVTNSDIDCPLKEIEKINIEYPEWSKMWRD